MPKGKKTSPDSDADHPRAYLSQTEVPRLTLLQALRVAQAINDNYAKQPTKPLRVADALDLAPTTGRFRELTSASAAYGVTEGTAWATQISLTQLGKRIVAPTQEGDEIAARIDAVLQPRIIREFLTRYDGSRFPSQQIALNVLEEMGVPEAACNRTLEVILKNATDLGLIRVINGQQYVDLQARVLDAGTSPSKSPDVGHGEMDSTPERLVSAPTISKQMASSNKRVFITHGSNREIVRQLKELLVFGEFEPVVSVERETTAKSVPDKVMDEMRGCGAAIVHVGVEQKFVEHTGREITVLNPNVLIEIGAAMALYGRKFILLVEDGVSLPSNLQGLYEVRYKGSRLEYESTMKLLKAFNDFKS